MGVSVEFKKEGSRGTGQVPSALLPQVLRQSVPRKEDRKEIAIATPTLKINIRWGPTPVNLKHYNRDQAILNAYSTGLMERDESILGPIGPEQQGKPSYMKYAEPRRINEIANQNLTTNQKVGSSSPPGRAIFDHVSR
jgi:hypothetical protein